MQTLVTTFDKGVYIGRLNPIHKGHEAVIDLMLSQFGPDDSVLILGSVDQKISWRHLFTYTQRVRFIRKLYPDLKIIAMPDYESDEEWMFALEEILYSLGTTYKRAKFFGGGTDDINWLPEGTVYELVDRHNGDTATISATRIREYLLQGESIDHLVNPKIKDAVFSLFHQRVKQLFSK